MIDACLAGPLKQVAAAFDEIICSWHLGVRKPEAGAFKRAAERLRCPPERLLLLLDDSAENVEAAIRCDWDASCVNGVDEVRAAIRRRITTYSIEITKP